MARKSNNPGKNILKSLAEFTIECDELHKLGFSVREIELMMYYKEYKKNKNKQKRKQQNENKII